MGVPKFFRYISERYPCLSELAREEKIPEFDNLYLDMNGIIHTCSHPDDGNVHFRITEEEMHRDIFNYIDKLFFLIKPRKLFFLAVDGVAPRAKMNQQRSRRFRSAKEAEILEKNAQKRGEKLPDTARFDSNCITPGTEFMARLQNSLKRFIKFKISSNAQWQGCRIILSGHETPGEGEHKIMEYIRYSKSQPDYDKNTRHCLYGLDADLIILGLCTHELHFSLLREEVSFGRKAKRTSLEETRFYLLHLTLLREYLELEFQVLKTLDGKFDVEKLIDDWILMGFLVGNDFIPHLPNMHITTNALPILYKAYIKCWPELKGNINENGELNLSRLQIFMETLAIYEKEFFEELNADLKYFEAKTSKEGIPEVFNFDIAEIKNDNVDSDLNKLIEETNMFMEDVMGENLSDENLCIDEEFAAYKRNYYIKKLKYNDVTPEILFEQTECYITALQWILYYYYKGVPSWSWFYPHHYAPFASDLENIKDLKIRFDPGRPFFPFQQLLAVLPAASKELLPEAFRDLMTNPNSSLIKYYPSDFETDLNGKKQEWEAVVLIPFIDEKDLLKAMEPRMKDLTEEEIKRNVHGPMLQYDYVKSNLPQDVRSESNSLKTDIFCTEKQIWREEILVKRQSVNNNEVKKIVHAGFPTMKHLNYKGELKYARVRVFEQPSRNESMILFPEINSDLNDIDNVAQKCLNKTVYIGWPHLIEAKVVAISTREKKIDQYGQVQENNPKVFELQCKGIYEHNMRRMGIDFQEISILVHALPLVGREYMYSVHGRMSLKKVWGSVEITYPIQGVVFDTSVQIPELQNEKRIEDLFPTGSSIFMLGHPYYGCEGRVLDPLLVYSCGRMKVSITVLPEPDFSESKRIYHELEAQYLNSYEAASIIGVQANCLARITGCIFVIKGNRREDLPENTPKINVGLHLRYPKNNEELVGYTRKVGNTWLYSHKAVNLVMTYHERFPKLFELISSNGSKDVFFESDLFSDQVGENTLSDLVSWLKEQEHTKAERVPCGTKTIQKEALESVISSIEKLKALPVTNVKLQVKPHLVLKPGLKLPEIYKPKKPLRLFDRVVIIKETYQVPFGYRGTIIAVHPVIDTNPVRVECINSVEIFYEILLDKELPEGSDMHGLGAGRIFKVSEQSILPTFEAETQFNEDARKDQKEINMDKRNKNYNNNVPYNKIWHNNLTLKTNVDEHKSKTGMNVINSAYKKSTNYMPEKPGNIFQEGDDKNLLDNNNLCTSFGKFEINKKEVDLRTDFIHPPIAKQTKYTKIDSDNKSQKEMEVNSLKSSLEYTNSKFATRGQESVHTKKNDDYFNFSGSRDIVKKSQKLTNETNRKKHESSKNFNINQENELAKNNPDKTEALKELLGIGSKSGIKEKQNNFTATALPQPPSSWRNNISIQELFISTSNYGPVITNYPAAPVANGQYSSSNQNRVFDCNYQQYPSSHVALMDMRTSNSQFNTRSGTLTSSLIPLQVLKGGSGMKKPAESRVNENGQTNLSQKDKKSCNKDIPSSTENFPERIQTESAKKKKKEILKRRAPRIAAKFDNI